MYSGYWAIVEVRKGTVRRVPAQCYRYYTIVRLNHLPLPPSFSFIHPLYTTYDYRVYKHRQQQQQLAIKNASLPHKDIFFKEPAYAKDAVADADVDVDANDDGPSWCGQFCGPIRKLWTHQFYEHEQHFHFYRLLTKICKQHLKVSGVLLGVFKKHFAFK